MSRSIPIHSVVMDFTEPFEDKGSLAQITMNVRNSDGAVSLAIDDYEYCAVMDRKGNIRALAGRPKSEASKFPNWPFPEPEMLQA